MLLCCFHTENCIVCVHCHFLLSSIMGKNNTHGTGKKPPPPAANPTSAKVPPAAAKSTAKHPPNHTAKCARTEFSFATGSAVAWTATPHCSTFKCKIDGIPRPQSRSFATTKASNGKVRMFSPSKANQKSFAAAFAKAAETAHATILTDKPGCPVHITVRFFFPRPKKHFTFHQQSGQLVLAPGAPTFVTKTPDIDNCVKLVLDALQDICFKTDCVVAHIDAAKLFDHTQTIWTEATKDRGCTIIKISKFDETFQEDGCTCLS